MPDLGNGHDRTFLAIYVCLLVFFYLNYYLLIPKLYFHRKKIWYFTFVFLALLFFIWMSDIFDRPFPEIFRQGPPMLPPGESSLPGRPPMDKPTQYEHTVLVYLIGIVSSLFFSINKRLQKTESEKVQAELSFLKAQINPHFLFNTLNSIYSLALAKDDKTADSIIQLSELMRYILDNANENAIALEKEINYLNNYILLQRSRLGNTVKIGYLVEGGFSGKQIAPLILISFIENAFKHGVNPDENSEIDIRILIAPHSLELNVENKKVHSVQEVSGIGMQNTLDRLELLYPQAYELNIRQDENTYAVKLTLNL